MGSDIDEEMAEKAIELARNSIESFVTNGKRERPGCMNDVFYERTGVLIKLCSERGRETVRGSAASYRRDKHLSEAIVSAAIEATSPSRGRSEIKKCELDTITVTMCIMDALQEIEDEPEDGLDLGNHGLIVEGSGGNGWMLPNMPIKYDWNETEFLDRACCKAGYKQGDWNDPNVTIYTFEGPIFKEETPGGEIERFELIEKKA